MHGLDVIRMIVASCCSHSPWLDVVGDYFAAVSKCFVTDTAFPALFGNLPVKQLAHLGW